MNNSIAMQSIQSEENDMITKSKERIGLRFDTIKQNLRICDLSSMTHNAIRIADNARALKEQNKISSNDYLDIIDKLDNIVSNSIRDCKCEKR